MKNLLYLCLFFSVCITSCTTYNSTQARYANIKSPGVYHIPIVADLDVKQNKVIGKSNSKVAGTTDIKTLKQNALADALILSSADLLIEPTYSTETNTANGMKTVSVNGWPANYKNFRQMKPDDIELIEMGLVKEMTSEMNSGASASANKKNLSKKGSIAAVVGVGLAGIVLTILINALVG